FEQPPVGWFPQPVENTSLYLHVPFCRHLCPYCPYTKVPYQESLIEPYTRAALREVDRWAETIGPTEITSIYIGGGTPTLALKSVAAIVKYVRDRLHLTGDICIETNPTDVNEETVKRLHDMDVTLVSLGVQSFQSENLALIGRDYNPTDAERALSLLAKSGFVSVNVDIMFALPHQTVASVLADLAHAAELGADQITTYPLFTFPYTSIGKYLRLNTLRMPNLKARRTQYQAINQWCEHNGFERVSVWGFRRGNVPRYSSVTRDGYIGIGPGAGSQMADGFVLNTFDLNSWMNALSVGRSAIALRMPFAGKMAGWWWLYWRFYDTRIPVDAINANLGRDAHKAHRLLRFIQLLGCAVQKDGFLEFTEPGAFWLHLAQNYFALNYVNTLWTQARLEPWPKSIKI
ncbi:MAG: coproporphyrinogen-III oxidase family protein, partial [Anaerolineaceae bacterium]